MPMALCLWLYAHGGVLMEWWCLAIIIADKELLQNIADISHGGVSMAPCSRHLPGGVLMVMRSWFYAHGSISIEVLPWWCAAPH